jgi:hypothetical protein
MFVILLIIKGVCSFSKFYHGAICDIDEWIPPVIEDSEGGGMHDTGEEDEYKFSG